MQDIRDDVERLRERLERSRAILREKNGGRLPDDEPSAPVCRHCKGAGFLALPFDPARSANQEIVPCDRCPQDVQHQRILRIAKRVGMEGFEAVTFSDTQPLPGQEQLYEDCLNYAIAPDGWLVLIGEPYRGKSHFARMIANEWLVSGKGVIWRGTISLMDELRDAALDNGRMVALREAFMHTPTLLLDDFARERPTPFAEEQMFEITDYRMERRLPTVVTCNLTLGELSRRNERLHRRLVDTSKCTVIVFDNSTITR